MSRLRAVCPNCGSDDITADAAVRWNIDEQEWTNVCTVYDNSNCNTCGAEFLDAEYIPIEAVPE